MREINVITIDTFMRKARRGRPPKIHEPEARTVRLPRELWTRIDALAMRREGTSTNDVLRSLLAAVAGSDLHARMALRALEAESRAASVIDKHGIE